MNPSSLGRGVRRVCRCGASVEERAAETQSPRTSQAKVPEERQPKDPCSAVVDPQPNAAKMAQALLALAKRAGRKRAGRTAMG